MLILEPALTGRAVCIINYGFIFIFISLMKFSCYDFLSKLHVPENDIIKSCSRLSSEEAINV